MPARFLLNSIKFIFVFLMGFSPLSTFADNEEKIATCVGTTRSFALLAIERERNPLMFLTDDLPDYGAIAAVGAGAGAGAVYGTVKGATASNKKPVKEFKELLKHTQELAKVTREGLLLKLEVTQLAQSGVPHPVAKTTRNGLEWESKETYLQRNSSANEAQYKRWVELYEKIEKTYKQINDIRGSSRFSNNKAFIDNLNTVISETLASAHRSMATPAKSQPSAPTTTTLLDPLTEKKKVWIKDVLDWAKQQPELYITSSRWQAAKRGAMIGASVGGGIGLGAALVAGRQAAIAKNCRIPMNQAAAVTKILDAALLKSDCSFTASGAVHILEMSDDDLADLCKDAPYLTQILGKDLTSTKGPFPMPGYMEPNCDTNSLLLTYFNRDHNLKFSPKSSGLVPVEGDIEFQITTVGSAKPTDRKVEFKTSWDAENRKFTQVTSNQFQPGQDSQSLAAYNLIERYYAFSANDKNSQESALNLPEVLIGESLHSTRLFQPVFEKYCARQRGKPSGDRDTPGEE